MRQQTQKLNKTPSTEVQAGVLSSGVTQTPSMPFVQQQKTKGQRMAETFGMFTEAVGKITGAVVQDMNAKEQAYQAIEGNADGVRYSQEVIEQARELPLEQQSAFIRNRMETRLDEMRQTNVSQSYLKSYMGSFMNGAGNFDAAVNKQVWQNKKAETLTKTVSLVQQSRMAGESHNQIMQNIMNANDTDRASAGELYTNSMAMLIKEQAQNDPNYDWQTAIDKHLKITSEDGAVSYATHPKYGKIIDDLESSLTTLTDARKTANDKVKKQKSLEVTNKMVSMSFNSETTAEDLAQAKVDLINNPNMFTSATQYKTALDAIDDALDIKGYSQIANTELKVGLKANASLGLLTLDQLRMRKSELTKEEYNEVANTIINYQSSVKGTTNEVISKGISNLRYNGGKLVAPMFDLDGSGADNINNFYTEFDTWLSSYVQENEGKWPSMKEAREKQKEIVETIMGTSKDTFSFNTENTNVTKGVQTVEDIIKTGDVGLLVEAAQNKIVEVKDNQPAKDLILNKGTMEEINNAIDVGIISEEEVINAYGPQTSTAPIGIGTQLQADDSSFELNPSDLKELQQAARSVLGEDGWNEFKTMLDTASQLKGNFNGVEDYTENQEPMEAMLDTEDAGYNYQKYSTILEDIKQAESGNTQYKEGELHAGQETISTNNPNGILNTTRYGVVVTDFPKLPNETDYAHAVRYYRDRVEPQLKSIKGIDKEPQEIVNKIASLAWNRGTLPKIDLTDEVKTRANILDVTTTDKKHSNGVINRSLQSYKAIADIKNWTAVSYIKTPKDSSGNFSISFYDSNDNLIYKDSRKATFKKGSSIRGGKKYLVSNREFVDIKSGTDIK